jgi:hypothetical protein
MRSSTGAQYGTWRARLKNTVQLSVLHGRAGAQVAQAVPHARAGGGPKSALSTVI